MKLQRKYQLNLFSIISILCVPFVIVLYLVIHFFIHDEIRELLEFQTEKIIVALEEKKEVKSIAPTIVVEKIEKQLPSSTLTKVPLYDMLSKETEEYIQLASVVDIENQYYLITVRTATVERADLFTSILIATIALLLGLGSIFYFFSKKLFNRLLEPFHVTLISLRTFSIREGKGLPFIKSEIDEFNELSKVTSSLSHKVSIDYQNLKQFTENASHEIQTPLAVIRNKIEGIMNDESLSESTCMAIERIDSAVNKLSSINKGLLLLSKIENKQFTKPRKISLGAIIEKESIGLKELYHNHDSIIGLDKQSEFIIAMNPSLAEILIRNLIKNMVTHSITKVDNKIVINSSHIVFSNKGEKSLNNIDQLFSRFYKQSSKENSIGLGLAIVKAICDQYEMEINYEYVEGTHRFILSKEIVES